MDLKNVLIFGVSTPPLRDMFRKVEKSIILSRVAIPTFGA